MLTVTKCQNVKFFKNEFIAIQICIYIKSLNPQLLLHEYVHANTYNDFIKQQSYFHIGFLNSDQTLHYKLCDICV